MKKEYAVWQVVLCSLVVCLVCTPSYARATAKDYLNDLSCWYDVPFSQDSAKWNGEVCNWILKTVVDTAEHTVYFYCDFTESSYASGSRTYDICVQLTNENAEYAPVYLRDAAAYDAFELQSNFSDSSAFGGAVCTFSIRLKNSRDYNVPNALSLVLYVNQHPYSIYETDTLALSGAAAEKLTSQTQPSTAPSAPAGADGQNSSAEKSATAAQSTKFHAQLGDLSAQTTVSKFSGSGAAAASAETTAVSGVSQNGKASVGASAQPSLGARTSSLTPAAKAGVGIAVVLLSAGTAFVLKGVLMRSKNKAENDVSQPLAPASDLKGTDAAETSCSDDLPSKE